MTLEVYRLYNYVAKYDEGFRVEEDYAYLFLQNDEEGVNAVTCVRDMGKSKFFPFFGDWSIHYAGRSEIRKMKDGKLVLIIPRICEDDEICYCNIKADIGEKGKFIKKGFGRRELNIPDNLNINRKTFNFLEKLWNGVLRKYTFVEESE